MQKQKNLNKKKIYLGIIILISIFCTLIILTFNLVPVFSSSANIIPESNSHRTTLVFDSDLYIKNADGYSNIGTINKDINLTIEEYLEDGYAKIEDTEYYIEQSNLTNNYIKTDYISLGNFRTVGSYSTNEETIIYNYEDNTQMGILENTNLNVVGYDPKTKKLFIDFFDYVGYIGNITNQNLEEIFNNQNINYITKNFNEYQTFTNDSCTYPLKTTKLIEQDLIKNICPEINTNIAIANAADKNKIIEMFNSFNTYNYKFSLVVPGEDYQLLQSYSNVFVQVFPIEILNTDLSTASYIFTKNKARCLEDRYICY